jgi:outer membrane beta-barrel protein
MSSRIAILGLFTLGVAALHGPPARSQTRAGSQDLQIYAGEMFGDRLTGTPLIGRYPLLNDDAVFGGRYTYNLTDQWGLQLSAGYSPNRAARVAGGDSNLGLTTADLDVVWNITPGFIFGGHTLIPYTELGAGYAWADLSRPLRSAMEATQVAIADGNGYTANVGLGAKYYLTSNFFVDFDARYRYLSKLVGSDSRGLNTGETTLSLAYQF